MTELAAFSNIIRNRFCAYTSLKLKIYFKRLESYYLDVTIRVGCVHDRLLEQWPQFYGVFQRYQVLLELLCSL